MERKSGKALKSGNRLSAVSALLISALMVLAALPTVSAVTPSVNDFVGPDYTTALTTAYGTGTVAYIKVVDPDIKTLTSTTVKVTSEIDTTGETITLNRYDSTTGTFIGSVGFETTYGANNGRVYVSNGKVVYMQYATPAYTDSLIWYITRTGTMTALNAGYYGEPGSPQVAIDVYDPDLGHSASPTVEVTSTSDTTGITVTLAEDGATYHYKGSFDFDTGASVPTATILVADGDIVIVNYTDARDAKGNEAYVTRSTIWHASYDGIAYFTDSKYLNPLAAGTVYNGLGNAYIMVTDNDADTSASNDVLNVKITSTSQGTSTNVALTESGPHTGEFIGSVQLVSSMTTGKLYVEDGDTLTVTYEDARDATGVKPTPYPTATATWNEAVTGTMELTTVNYITPATDYYGDGAATTYGKVYVKVVDSDLGASDIPALGSPVKIKSDLYPEGIEVGLTYVAIPTPHFTGSLAFSPYAYSATDIWVIDGSTITATYTDADTATGATNVAIVDTAVWHESDDATIDIELANYNGVTYAASTTGVPRAYVTVTDIDANVNKGTKEKVTVTVKSAASDTDGIPILCEEITNNCGIFRGSFGFSTTASSTTNGLIKVVNAEVVTAYYDEAYAADGSNPAATALSDTTIWNAVTATGVVELNSDKYYGASSTKTATVYVYDTSLTSGATIGISSDTDPVAGLPPAPPITATLTQTGTGTGVWKATFGFSTTASSDASDLIWVADGDSVYVTSGSDTPAVDPTWYAYETGTAKICDDAAYSNSPSDLKFFGVADKMYLIVDDVDYAADTGLIEAREVSIGGETIGLIECDATFAPDADGTLFCREVLFEAASGTSNGKAYTTTGTGGGGTVTISYSDGHPTTGTSATITDTATWYPGGTIDFKTSSAYTTTAAEYVGFATVYIEALDYCANKDAGSTTAMDILIVTVDSVDGADSVDVTLYETGLDTSIFRGSTALEDFGGGDIAKVEIGTATTDKDDTLKVYHKTTPAQGWIYDSLGCWKSTTAAVNFYTGSDYGTTTTTYNSFTTVYVEVDDQDWGSDKTNNSADTMSVTIFSDSDGTGFSLTLTESGARSGLFHGTFGFTTGTTGSGMIKVEDGDTVGVRYADPKKLDGSSGNVLGDFTWEETQTGSIVISGTHFVGTTATATVTLTDNDLNADPNILDSTTTEVQITSDSDTLGPSALILTETDINSGIFTGTFQFDGTLFTVSDKDVVTVTYTDAFDSAGVVGTDRIATCKWYEYGGAGKYSGYVKFDTTVYYTSSATGTITVYDPDANIVSTSLDTVIVKLLSNSDGAGEFITLTETGVNSNTFSTGASKVSLFETTYAAGNGKVYVANGDTVSVIYYDASDSTGAVATDIATATWSSTANASPTATLSASPASGTAPLTVTFTMGASDSDGTIASWSLNFGDGTSAATGIGTPSSTTHSYSAAGTYTATLTVTDNIGATGTKTTTVTVTSTATDTTRPTASIAYSKANVKSGDSLVITATFNEAMADSPAPKIAISGANTLAAAAMTKTSSTVYTYTHTVGAGDGTATVALSVGTDAAGNLITSAPTSGATFTVDNTAPAISSGTVGANNVYIDVVFSEGVYSAAAGTGALETSDLTLTFAQNGGTATAAAISSVKKTDGTALAGGEATIRVGLTVTGTPTGVETVEIKPASDAAVYDKAGNAALSTTTTGAENLLVLTPDAPTSADGPIINAAEKSAGVHISVEFGVSGAVAGDILEILLGGAPFSTAQTHVLTAADITAATYTFTVPSAVWGADGAKSITARLNAGTASAALALTFDTAIPTGAVTYSATSIKSGDSLIINVTFSEAMLDSPAPKIAITGAVTLEAVAMTKVDSTHYTYAYTVGEGSGTATVWLSIGTDAAGNVVTSVPTSGATFKVGKAAIPGFGLIGVLLAGAIVLAIASADKARKGKK